MSQCSMPFSILLNSKGAIILLYLCPLLPIIGLYVLWPRLCAFFANRMLYYNAFVFLVSIRADSFVRKLLKNQFETLCSQVSFSIYDYIILVQVDTFVTEHHSIAAKINFKRCLYLQPFYRLPLPIFLSQWIIVCLQFFLSLGHLQRVLGGRHEWLVGDFENFLDGGSMRMFDSLRCCKILDTSLKLGSFWSF